MLVEAIMKDRSRSPSLSVTFRLPHNGGVMTKMQSGMIANKRAMVAFLLDHGADLNLGSEFRNGLLRPPLIVAAGEGLDWAVEELIKYGVDCNARAMVCRKPEPREHRLDSAFRRTYIQPEPADLIQGGSALIYTVRSEQLSTVRLLLAYGSNIRLVDEHGRTALECACAMSRIMPGIGQSDEIKQVLMEHDETMGRSAR